MSVHGEYSRTLEALLNSVRLIEDEQGTQWADALEEARVSRHSDLSAAATACLAVLETIEARRDLSSPSGIGPDMDPLRDPFQHLKAHCETVLGVSNPGAKAGQFRA